MTLQERYYIQLKPQQRRPSEASKYTKSLGRRGPAWGLKNSTTHAIAGFRVEKWKGWEGDEEDGEDRGEGREGDFFTFWHNTKSQTSLGGLLYILLQIPCIGRQRKSVKNEHWLTLWTKLLQSYKG